MQRNLRRMKIAEQQFLEWATHQRLQRAIHSRGRQRLQYQPGDLVFIWRKQISGERGNKNGRFIGPARILAMESKPGGEHDSQSIWCVRGRRLLKCCQEQLRPASEREELLSDLEASTYEDWNFHRTAQELGGNEYDDVSNEIPDEEEWLRAQDRQQEVQPTHRFRGKRALQHDGRPADLPGDGGPSSSSSLAHHWAEETYWETPIIHQNHGKALYKVSPGMRNQCSRATSRTV